ncbi:ATP-dependent DNA helicase sgs1 [Orbilia oligospora]|nr:ATP-dependent DNA helicase sgs1 [Orbilia oligospora]
MTTKSKGPKNNLSSHLAWLIREKPTIPPPRTQKPPSAQAISAATLAAIETHSRQNPSVAGPSTAGTGGVISLSRANSAATATAVSQPRELSQQKDIPLFGRSDSFGHDPGGGSASRSIDFAHQAPQTDLRASATVARGITAGDMPTLQLAKTPSNRRTLTSIQRKEPSPNENDEEDPYVPVPRKTALARKAPIQERLQSDSDGESDPYEPVSRKKVSQVGPATVRKNGDSLLEQYTQHCANGKGIKTPTATKKVVLPTGPVESIDLTMSDDDIPNLPTSRFKRELSTRSATATPSRTIAPEKATLPIGPSDPPPPYASQELPISRQKDDVSKGHVFGKAGRIATTGCSSIKTKCKTISKESQGDETPNVRTVDRAQAALVNGEGTNISVSTAAGAVRSARKRPTIVYDSEGDDSADLSDNSATVGRGSVAGDNTDLPAKRSVSVSGFERSRISVFKSPSPARAVSFNHRDNSPKVSMEDTMVVRSSPFHRSPSRTKRMNQRNATPDPKELAKNLAAYLSPATEKENIQSPLRGAIPAPVVDSDLSQQKRRIEKEMADVTDMIHAYTSNTYKGSMTLVQMAIKYEELKRTLAGLEGTSHDILGQIHNILPPRTPDHIAVDVYATQNFVENTPIRKPFLARVAEEPTQFVKQTQYPVRSKLANESADERVSATMVPKGCDTMDVDDNIGEGKDAEGNPFDMQISSPPDAEYTAPSSPAQRTLDKGKGRATEEDIEEDLDGLNSLDSDDIPDEFFDFENEIHDQVQEKDPSGSGAHSFNIEEYDENDFELSPEDLAEIEGRPLDQRSRSPSSDIEVLEQPPPNIFEARAKAVSQFAKDHDHLNEEDVELDEDIMEIGTQKAVEVNMGAPSMNHPWSTDVARALKTTFKLKGFRANQLEAINATLGGNDVFVLMPTGGGKSLCYQLPAVVSSGKTKGITFVISPLLSLMEDQVDHLGALKIRAFMFNSSITAEERREILKELKSPDAATSIQLLYVTPEMLASSKMMEAAMGSLHKRNLIARVVIDEAHCVSQWGHDFRKDYKELGKLRTGLRGVPFMALTATATPQVQQDLMRNLSITKCKTFKQSFNRPNLVYEVLEKVKGGQVIQDIINLIQTSYKGKCGIVYCLSKNDCEQVSSHLQKARILANFYHAGLTTDERRNVQKRWQCGELKVIVATIAFGMGIDKPDVRFVIHHSIPKSLEGYYQETGRAGRDGKISGCYLFYSGNDMMRILKMIETGEGATDFTIDHGKAMVRAVANYCDNKVECRRMQVLRYFAERYDPADCKKTCDNCKSGIKYNPRDVTDEAKAVLSIVDGAQGKNLTTANILDIFKGSRQKLIMENGWNNLDGFGQGKSWEKDASTRLVERLIAEDIICQNYVPNKSGFTNTYIIPGKKQKELSNGRKFEMTFDRSPTAPKKGARIKASNDQDFESTNVSSPIPPSKGKSRKAATVQNTQPDDDGFMPIRDGGSSIAGKKRKSDGIVDNKAAPRRKKVAAEPIGVAADNIRAGLNHYELDILERFLKDAKRVRGELMNERGLRVESIFTDTELSWMGRKLPCSMNELAAISHIQDKERIRLYGPKFLPITQKYNNEKLENYEGTQYTHGGETQTHLPGIDGFLEEDFDEDYVDDDDDDDGEESRYFSNTAEKSQAASDFSARMAAASQAKSSTTTKSTARAPRRASGGGRGRGGKKFFKRASGGGAKSSRGGAKSGRGGSKGGRGGSGSSGIRPMI